MSLPLKPGSICRIRSLGKDPLVAHRLAEMGILPGMEVSIVRIGPLGDPLEIATEFGQHIALRTEEAASLDCEVVAAPLSALPLDGKTPHRVHRLLGGRVFRERMAAAGLKEGTVFTAEGGPPFRLRLPEGRVIVLGRGEAEKVIVSRA
ncbi:MAG: hypothetical protein D6819_08280 [Gammaproteobacteria bacterium]|nr:MAG: hypothetical protein D6819_08280 [Gammaproteobacteria bacterium]